jgi:hypothetical protein
MSLRRRLEPLVLALRMAILGAPGHHQAALAERDRWKARAEICEYSFRTTAADRDRLKEMASELADPLDAGFFRLDFARFAFGKGEQGSSRAREWTALIERGAHAELMQSVLANVPVRVAHALEGEYFRPFCSLLPRLAAGGPQ